MKITAQIKNEKDRHEVTVSTNGAARQIAIPPKASGYGSSANGAELLLLSIATCFCNDIYREAAKKNLAIHGIEVTATGEFGGDGESGFNFEYKTSIQSDASPAEIEELIHHVNEIAEIHQTLRKGINVRLT